MIKALPGSLSNKFRLILASICILIDSTVSCAADAVTGIVFPKVREPYNQVFIAFSKGISEYQNGETRLYELQSNADPQEFLTWAKEKQINGVVALGKRSLRLMQDIQSNLEMPVVAGASFLSVDNPPGFSGISMAPSPKQLFKHLLTLSPEVKVINLVYREDQDNGLVKIAREDASSLGLTLNALASEDTRQLAVGYRKILDSQKSKTEALWVAHNGIALEKALIQNVLGTAWKRNLIVFSSNLADVKKGVLFSRYPDKIAVGRKLAELLDVHRKSKQPEEIFLSEGLFSALNTRTADHLGIRVSKEEMRDYKLRFPMSR